MPARSKQSQQFHARQRFHFDLRIRTEFAVIDIFGETADAVAAHFGFAAVGVEHPHLVIGHFGGQNQQQAVAANAELAVTQATADVAVLRFFKGFRQGIDDNKIVADAVHFREFHLDFTFNSCNQPLFGQPAELAILRGN